MGSGLRHVSSVAGATMVSRILGLFRDVFLFAGLGAGPFLSAFVVAFTLPNLFRRLLGEGALTSSVVPVLAHRLEEEGREASFLTINRVLTRLALTLLAISLVGGVSLVLLTMLPGLTPRWVLAGRLSALLLPYAFFICLAAMLAAQLNVLQRFFVPALSPVVLNCTMILALVAGVAWLPVGGVDRVLLLSGGVILGGVLQVLICGWALRGEGWRLKLDAKRSPALEEIWRLLLPGLIGAGVLQVNLMLTRLLAFSIDDAAASILYLASRLVELPYGVFAVAVTTVAFPQMARAVGRGDSAGFSRAYERGREAIWMITLPAAMGLWLLAEPILITLFEWGLFDSRDVQRTVQPLRIMALSLPFFSWTILATRGLHSWKEMRIPVRYGIVNGFINLSLGLLLMQFWRESGLAAANVIASIVLTILLERALWRRGVIGWGRHTVKKLLPLLLATGAMGCGVWLWQEMVSSLDWTSKGRAIIMVGGGIPIGVGLYFGSCILMRVEALGVLWEWIRPGRKRG